MATFWPLSPVHAPDVSRDSGVMPCRGAAALFAAAPQAIRADPKQQSNTVTIRSMRAEDDAEARAVILAAFSQQAGMPVSGGYPTANQTRLTRREYCQVALVAEGPGGQILGVNFATAWGTAAFFGPLAVVPGMQNRGAPGAHAEAGRLPLSTAMTVPPAYSHCL